LDEHRKKGYGYNVTLPSSVVNGRTLFPYATRRKTLEFVTTDGGTTVTLVRETDTD